MQALNRVPDGKHSKNAFDLSNFETFHQKGGMLQVVGVRDTMPDSDIQMSVDGLTKTLLCNTANFAHIKENYYFVHVPLYLICSNAYQMLVQRKQSFSALNQAIEQFPTFDLADVVKYCLEVGSKADDDLLDADVDVHGFNIGVGALRLLDMLGYGYYGDFLQAIKNGDMRLSEAKAIVETAFGDVKPSVARIAAYQCVWYNFFRNDIYDNRIDASIYNFDDCTLDVAGKNYCVTSYRTVKDFVTKCLQLRYVPYKKDIFMSSMPGTQFGAVSTVSLMDNVVMDLSGNAQTSSYMTDLESSTSVVSGDPATVVGYPVVLQPDADSGEYGRIATSYAPVGASNVRLYTDHKHTVPFGGTTASFTAGTSLFDVLSLVESQAIQKWRQKAMLAGNKTINQFKAHHGVVPRHLIDHLPDFIGSVDNEILIKEITSQANTLDASDGENNLGEIRGRGYGASDNRTFRFHSNDYGVLLLLHAIVPENTYSSFGLDKGNMMVYYSDFAQSEFENIGLEAVPKIMLNTLARYPFPEVAHGSGGIDFADSTDEGNCGYAPRYYGYKQYPSRVHGLFNPNRIADTLFDPQGADIFGYSDMQSFVLTRRDMVGRLLYNHSDVPDAPVGAITLPSLSMSLSKLYVNPSVFDSIFAFDADNSFDTDTFFTQARFGCLAYQPITVLGLPQF